MYGLRKIEKDGKNFYNNFVWPLEVGAEVETPDWNPEPFCGGGLHCLPNAIGNWDLLHGHYWAVLEFDKKDMVLIDSEKCKVKKCKIIFLSKSRKGMIKFFDYEKFDSETACFWVAKIGNKDIMIDRITESEWAYWWALVMGNQDIMIDRITNSEDAYYWARFIGNRNKMINRITEPKWAFEWIRNVGNRKEMIARFPDIVDRWKYI